MTLEQIIFYALLAVAGLISLFLVWCGIKAAMGKRCRCCRVKMVKVARPYFRYECPSCGDWSDLI